ncbi:MAG: hypothetical protein U1F98_06730 [Verrucomicrobiota bacterium]
MNAAASSRETARAVRSALPEGGLFAGQSWRISPEPFPLDPAIVKELESLGRVFLQFYRAANLLYRKSAEGKQPDWVARWLDLGKPRELIELQRSQSLKNEIPRVIRPDLLLTDDGIRVTELDSVPGGIGLTAWLNATYSKISPPDVAGRLIGGADAMIRGFAGIFGSAPRVHIVVSEESASYRPEMDWIVARLNETSPGRYAVRPPDFLEFAPGDAVYRFFELFDLPQVPSAAALFAKAAAREIRLTPPPKPVFEEKMLFALLWNRNLQGFWRQELGESFFQRMLQITPRTWLLDPAPLPPQGAIPELNLTDWSQLKLLSQKERDLILKVSGYSELAWGARGVHLGSDLPHDAWSRAVDDAIAGFERHPSVLQRYHKPALVDAAWFDFDREELTPMKGRARLCPYYFVSGDGDAARAEWCGLLATICPADKKIIHGMTDAILAPGMKGV